jgi:hypothetical protein
MQPHGRRIIRILKAVKTQDGENTLLSLVKSFLGADITSVSMEEIEAFPNRYLDDPEDIKKYNSWPVVDKRSAVAKHKENIAFAEKLTKVAESLIENYEDIAEDLDTLLQELLGVSDEQFAQITLKEYKSYLMQVFQDNKDFFTA